MNKAILLVGLLNMSGFAQMSTGCTQQYPSMSTVGSFPYTTISIDEQEKTITIKILTDKTNYQTLQVGPPIKTKETKIFTIYFSSYTVESSMEYLEEKSKWKGRKK